MSVGVKFHCPDCERQHNLKIRLEIIDSFIKEAEKSGDRRMHQKLKASRLEVEDEMLKIQTFHKDADKTQGQRFFE